MPLTVQGILLEWSIGGSWELIVQKTKSELYHEARRTRIRLAGVRFRSYPNQLNPKKAIALFMLSQGLFILSPFLAIFSLLVGAIAAYLGLIFFAISMLVLLVFVHEHDKMVADSFELIDRLYPELIATMKEHQQEAVLSEESSDTI